MWQPHCSSEALTPPPKDRDVSEERQVELVYLGHSCEQVEFKAILFLCYSYYFIILDFIEDMCCYFK